MTFEKELFYQQFSLKYVLLYQKVRYKLFSRPIVTLSSCIIKRPNYFIKWLRSTWTFSLNEKRDYNPIILLFTTTWNPICLFICLHINPILIAHFFLTQNNAAAHYSTMSHSYLKKIIYLVYIILTTIFVFIFNC